MLYTINTSDQLKPILVGFRKTHGLSQKNMADKLGISQQSYQVLESKPQNVTVDRLLRVLSILGVKLVLSDQIVSKVGFDNQALLDRSPLDKALLNKKDHLVKEPDGDAW